MKNLKEMTYEEICEYENTLPPMDEEFKNLEIFHDSLEYDILM